MKSRFMLSIPFAAALGAAAIAAVPVDECAASKAVPVSFTAEKDIVQTAVEAGSFRTLAAALKAADLVGALQGEGPFTVFAPTDEAFAKLPKGTLEALLKPENRDQLTTILTYHVVPGRVMARDVIKVKNASSLNGQRIGVSVDEGVVTVAGATVVKTDIACSNGVIHVVDSIMLPSTDDLIETAVAAGRFKTLAAAIQAAGLLEALKGEGPFTVFAPTDEAFAKLPAGTVETLLKPESKERLQAILKYHVVAGRVYSDKALELGTAKTLQGGELKIHVRDEQAMVGSAKILSTDLDATNGVIHVIDSVLLPE